MKAIKQLLRPERLRQVPQQFSWVDQALVQQHFIDRCESRSAALYLFLVTVSDAQGLSYYGAATLIAYRAPLYQVLALPGTVAPRARANTGADTGGQPVSLAMLLQQAQARRG